MVSRLKTDEVSDGSVERGVADLSLVDATRTATTGVPPPRSDALQGLRSEIRRHWHWALPVFPLLVILWGPLQWAWKTWSVPDSPQAYQPFVPLAAGFLVWVRRHELAGLYQSTRNSPRGQLWLVLIGCAILLTSHAAQLASISFFGLIVTGAGVVLYIYGARMLRALTVPILLLMTMIPLPGFVVDQPTQQLQLASTSAAGRILDTLRVPTLVEGTSLMTREYSCRVGAACSGMGILLPLFVMTLWLLVLMEATPGQRVFLLFLSFWVAVAMNVARIVVTMLVGQIEKDLASMLHDASAWIFTALAFYLTYLASRAIGIRELHHPVFNDRTGLDGRQGPARP
jgi:exosortase